MTSTLFFISNRIRSDLRCGEPLVWLRPDEAEHLLLLAEQVEGLLATIREREAEIYRLRTEENRASVQLEQLIADGMHFRDQP